MKKKLKSYAVTYFYGGHVTVVVEAASKEEADKLGLAEADETIGTNLTVTDVDIKELTT